MKKIIEIDKMFRGNRSLNQKHHSVRCLFFININLFRHLKLDITSAIPAANEKYLAAQYLKLGI